VWFYVNGEMVAGIYAPLKKERANKMV
jgi:hypothetical protein